MQFDKYTIAVIKSMPNSRHVHASKAWLALGLQPLARIAGGKRQGASQAAPQAVSQSAQPVVAPCKKRRPSAFTESDIRVILQLRKEGLKYHQIAERFAVNSIDIARIVNNKRWKHLA